MCDASVCDATVRGSHGLSARRLRRTKSRRPEGQFCTTPPGGILVGSSLKSVGWIPTVAIPNPDHDFSDISLLLYQKGNLMNTK